MADSPRFTVPTDTQTRPLFVLIASALGALANCEKSGNGFAQTWRGRLSDIERGLLPSGSGFDGDRATGSATFTASRDYDREPVPVIFRAVKTGQHKGTVDAFFPTLAGTRDPWTCTVYTRVGQHCTGFRDHYRDTRPATVEESALLARELESLGYVLEVRKRWTPEFDTIRFNALHRSLHNDS